ncbi:MAG: ChaN family lipoprotein [Acidobacteria bacterium]|nr:ChaN family lipoprotein [Acidobacteriota bacterium]
MIRFSPALLLAVVSAATGQSPAATPVPPATISAVPSYVPQRVFDTRRQGFTDFEVMLADLARADVIFVGEQHDDPNTHRLETAVLQGLLRRKVAIVVSLEMFERDTQSARDAYLAGGMTEEEFLQGARPWPRYATDYRPLVELAKAHGWPVVAANVPRRHASAIAKAGRPALDGLPPSERALAAREFDCPADAYFSRFTASMGSHPAPGGATMSASDQQAATERFYLSQCVKDETMAESIVTAFENLRGAPATIVHYNGSFHSDFGHGTAARVRRRLRGRRVAVVTMLPVDSLDTLAPSGDDLERADYLVYTTK